MIPIGKLFDIEKGELQSTKCTPGDYDFITAAEDWKTHSEYSHECEALIFAAAASGSLGRTHYVDGKFTTSDLCYILTPKDEAKYPLNLSFYHFVFNSLRPTLVAATKSGTSKESINQTNFKNYKIPYFNIELQNFWIEKLKNTLGLKDLLGCELTHQQTLLKKLRQQILQEAVEGKLTADWRAQNPTMEPASELLKRIAVDKMRLVKEKKIKAQKPLPPITDEEKPFELPQGWEWCQLGDICYKITDGFHHTPKKYQEGEVYISATHIRDNKIDWAKCLFISKEDHEYLYKKARPLKGEILITNRGAGCATPAIIDTEQEFSFQNVALLGFDQKLISNKYVLFFLLKSRDEIVSEFVNGGLQPMLSNVRLSMIPLPFPCANEQQAIVTKVEKLLALCGQLETLITQNQTHTEQLMQAVLKEAFSHSEAKPKATPKASAHA